MAGFVCACFPQRPAAVPTYGAKTIPKRQGSAPARALPNAQIALIADIAEKAAPGSVEAPTFVVIAATAAISAAVLLGVSFALKPGIVYLLSYMHSWTRQLNGSQPVLRRYGCGN